MYKLYICLLFIYFNVLLCDSVGSVVDNTELILTFLVHRHGDRTPVESTVFLSTDPKTLVSLSAKYGYGQLTDVGIHRGFELGQFIRRRYDSLLSPQYNRSEIYIRSTDSTRTKMTVLSAMAAVYPVSQDNWSDNIHWTPVPYTTMPALYDYNLAVVNCPTFISGYRALFTAPAPAPSMAKYKNILDQWSELIGLNITAYPAIAYIIYDVYSSQMSLGMPLDPEIEAMFPEIEEVAGAAIDIIFGNKDYIALQAGVLLNEFFEVIDQVISGVAVPRVQVYSAHDINVFSFEAVTQVKPRQGVPKYGSAYALELRKVVDTGEYVVVPVYLDTPSAEAVTYLQVDGCEELCNLKSFRDLTSKYVLDEDEWRTQCDFSEDHNFDMSSID